MNKRLIVLACLVLCIWLGVYFLPKHKTEEKKVDAAWPAFTMASTDRIDQKSARHSYSIRKTNGEWFAAQPGVPEPGLRLDITKVDALLNYVGSHPPKRRLGDVGADESKTFGLDNPATSITFYGESQWTIQLGAQNATSTGVFAESSKESGEVLLLDTTYAEQFTRDVGHYYDLRLLPLVADAVKRIRLETSGGTGWEINVKDGKAVFSSPANMTQKKVSATELDGYLRNLTAVHGEGFLLNAPVPHGDPAATLRIWSSGAKDPMEVRFYKSSGATAETDGKDPLSPPKKAPDLVAVSSWQNAPLTLAPGARAKVFRTAFSLRDRSVLQLAPGQVERQVVKHEATGGSPQAELTATRSESGWQVNGKERQGLDMLLWRLSDLQYADEPQATLPEGARKELTWKLYGAKQALKHTLVFYRVPGYAGPQGLLWIAVEGKAPYYPVGTKLAGDLAALFSVAATSAKDGEDAPAGTVQPPKTTE